MTTPLPRVAVLASGRGSNLAALLAARERGELPVDFVLVGSDKASAGALRLAPAAHRAVAAGLFTVVWLAVSAWNLRAGLAHGYSLAEELPLERLADQAGMSLRTFLRRFREATGTTPAEWLVGERLALARDLLETTDLPVERIATECGFGSADTLRPMLESAGLVWVNTDAGKLEAAQQVAAQIVKPARAPRERKALAPVDATPMQQVETSRQP